jgi:hypothetical protein
MKIAPKITAIELMALRNEMKDDKSTNQVPLQSLRTSLILTGNRVTEIESISHSELSRSQQPIKSLVSQEKRICVPADKIRGRLHKWANAYFCTL